VPTLCVGPGGKGTAVEMLDLGSTGDFLYFGYVPKRASAPIDFLGECSMQPKREEMAPQRDLGKLAVEGVPILRAAIRESVQAAGGEKLHVLPLSGGMDSRAILGGLLESIETSRIHTITFGIPGTWDFDIGTMVAERAGVKNIQIDLSEVSWNVDTLLEFASQCERPTPLFEAYLFHQTRMHFDKNAVHWSGFMGDPLAGSHLLREDSTAWDVARTRFAERNRFARSVTLTPSAFSPERWLPESPLLDSNLLCFDEQLDFAIRQECYVRPLVLLKGFSYALPFLYPPWVRFMLSVPRRYRTNQVLYKEILKTAYPKLFALPVKNNFGLPLTASRSRRGLRRQRLRLRGAARRFLPRIDWGTSPSINYIDFDRGLRDRDDLKAVVYESIQDLKKRRIVDWIDIDAIWNRHQNRQANHADALTLLASLEINLKAQETFAG